MTLGCYQLAHGKITVRILCTTVYMVYTNADRSHFLMIFFKKCKWNTAYPGYREVLMDGRCVVCTLVSPWFMRYSSWHPLRPALTLAGSQIQMIDING